MALSQQNLERHVQVTLPHILAIPAMIASTDLIVTVATRIANRFAKDYNLQMFSPPIALAGFDISMAWHQSTNNDKAIQWLRSELISIGQIIATGVQV